MAEETPLMTPTPTPAAPEATATPDNPAPAPTAETPIQMVPETAGVSMAKQRNSYLIWILVAGVVVILAAVGFLFWQSQQAATPVVPVATVRPRTSPTPMPTATPTPTPMPTVSPSPTPTPSPTATISSTITY